MPGQIVVQRPTAAAYAFANGAVIIGPNDDEKCLWVEALIDTGATHSLLHRDILRSLYISNTSRSLALVGVAGMGDSTTAWVKLGFRGDSDATVTINQEIAVSDAAAEQLLLRLDVLQHFDLSFERSGRFSMTWR